MSSRMRSGDRQAQTERVAVRFLWQHATSNAESTSKRPDARTSEMAFTLCLIAVDCGVLTCPRPGCTEQDSNGICVAAEHRLAIRDPRLGRTASCCVPSDCRRSGLPGDMRDDLARQHGGCAVADIPLRLGGFACPARVKTDGLLARHSLVLGGMSFPRKQGPCVGMTGRRSEACLTRYGAQPPF